MYKMQFLSDLVTFINIVFDMIAFRNPYLVKSVNLTFMHVLFRSRLFTMTLFLAMSRPEMLASFFNQRLTRLIPSK